MKGVDRWRSCHSCPCRIVAFSCPCRHLCHHSCHHHTVVALSFSPMFSPSFAPPPLICVSLFARASPHSRPPSLATCLRMSLFARARLRSPPVLACPWYGVGCFVGAGAGDVALTADDGEVGVQQWWQQRCCCHHCLRQRSLPLSWVLSSSGGEGGLGGLPGHVAIGSSSSLLLLPSFPPLGHTMCVVVVVE